MVEISVLRYLLRDVLVPSGAGSSAWDRGTSMGQGDLLFSTAQRGVGCPPRCRGHPLPQVGRGSPGPRGEQGLALASMILGNVGGPREYIRGLGCYLRRRLLSLWICSDLWAHLPLGRAHCSPWAAGDATPEVGLGVSISAGSFWEALQRDAPRKSL